MSLLPYEINRFGGAEIVLTDNDALTAGFAQYLDSTLNELTGRDVPLVWLFLPLSMAALVPIAVNQGFSYHHADGVGLQLVQQLKPGSFVPSYASHYIGAGGVILDENDNLLVISERFHTRKHYKLPGGTLNYGENIADAVMREVKEETGIETEFISLAGFRHWHEYRFGKSDIYFVCRLKPLTYDLTLDPEEIDEGFWMPVSEYLNREDTHDFNRLIVETALSKNSLNLKEIPGYGTPESIELFF